MKKAHSHWRLLFFIFALFILPAAVFSFPSQQAPVVPEDFAKQLDDYRQQLKIPGMSAAVIRDGEVIWEQGFGMADKEKGIKATPDTPYYLASVTKTFGAHVIMKLVQEGKLDLDAPVKDFGIILPDDKGITVRHLLSHTSRNPPGYGYRYDGNRYSYLGKIIEKVSGKSFEELVVTQILQPAGMKQTARYIPEQLDPKDSEGKRLSDVPEWDGVTRAVNLGIAAPYRLNDKLEIEKCTYLDHWSPSAGLVSTVRDMAKYDKGIDTNLFLPPEANERMWTATVSHGGRTLPYGLGWFVQEFEGVRLFWHYGYGTGDSSLFLKVPQKKLTFVILANTYDLSRPFGLGGGNVLKSAFAVEFLKRIALRDMFTHEPPAAGWLQDPDAAAARLEAIPGGDESEKENDVLKELLKWELIGNWGLNRLMERTERRDAMHRLYRRFFTVNPLDRYRDLPVLASIEGVKDKHYSTKPFTLEEDKTLRIYAVGEGGSGGLSDYGGIEDAETGQLVWEQYHLTTTHAGGANKNRCTDRLISLPGGTYRLHFRGDDSHDLGKWNAQPPDHNYWGIRIMDASAGPDAPPPTCWKRAATPEALGWSKEKLEALIPLLEKWHSSAMMIVTGGRIAYQWQRTASNIYSHSVRKSMISALYGIYAAEGKIDLSKTIGELGITARLPLTETEKQATVSDLLKARSGIYIPAAAESASMSASRPKRGSHAPGTFWYYNNWDFNVLGTIFRQETGEDIYEAFGERIARPIGMQDYSASWQEYSYQLDLSPHPGYLFLISARDLARFGQLFLQKGQWEGKQVLPEGWVEESTRTHSDTGRRGTGYGYMWWTITGNKHGMKGGDYFASGFGGQKLFVLPRLNSVVVLRANIYLPGVDYKVSGVAPYKLIPLILEAYTGTKSSATAGKTKSIMPEQELLKDYGKVTRQNPGLYRLFFWILALICVSVITVWPLGYVVKRIRFAVVKDSKREKTPLYVAIIRFMAWFNALGTGIYCAALLRGDNLEVLMQTGMPDPAMLELWKRMLIGFPFVSVFLTVVLLVFNVPLWRKKYWYLWERLHYTMATAGFVFYLTVCYLLGFVV